MHITVIKLGGHQPQQFKQLLALFADVFEMNNYHPPEDTYLQKLLLKDDFYVFVALWETKVVGGLTAYTLSQYYSAQPLLYIYDLAVTTSFQRKGIGKMLVAGIQDWGKTLFAEEVFVQADEVDKEALDFYRSTGGREERVRHFTYRL